jgi:predicted O-methyltransferase YrrM
MMLDRIRLYARTAFTGKPMPFSGRDLINRVMVASGRKPASAAEWDSWLEDLRGDAVMAEAYDRAKPVLAHRSGTADRYLISWHERVAAAMAQVEVFYMMTRALRPVSILETGVAFGMTTSLVVAALRHNGSGRLLSIDRPNIDIHVHVGDSETGILVPEAYRDRWQLVEADAVYELPARIRDSGVDMFVHDSMHTYEHMAYEFCLAAMHLPHNGILISDDILWNSAFVDVTRALGFKTFSHGKNHQFGIAVVAKNGRPNSVAGA